MRVLIFKAVTFLFLLLFGSQVLIKPFIYHEFWGAPLFISKYDRFFNPESDHNAVFVGSSRTFRNTDPSVFDSITGLKSFNFGIEEVGCPFNYTLTEKIISSKKAENLDYLFLELFSPEGNLPEELMTDVNQTNKSLFWNEPFGFVFSVRALTESKTLSISEKTTEIKVHLFAFLQSAFKLGFVQRILDSESKRLHDDYLGALRNGYYSYDEEFATPFGGYLADRITEMQQHPELLEERMFSSSSRYLNGLKTSNGLRFHWKYLEQLVSKCEKKGIQLILVVHPRMTKAQCDYFHYFNLNGFDRTPVLNYSSSDVYPEYYEDEYLFDKGHLNGKGAAKFTATFAHDVNRLLNLDHE